MITPQMQWTPRGAHLLLQVRTQDQAFADRLHSRMVQEKLRVWYPPEDMRGGRKGVDQIDQAIRVHDKLLLVLSKASMESGWVRYEIKRGGPKGDSHQIWRTWRTWRGER